jgi:hypothetical protein
MGWVHSTHTNFWHDKHAQSRREIIENMASDGSGAVAEILRMLAAFAGTSVQAKYDAGHTTLEVDKLGIAHWQDLQKLLERTADRIDHWGPMLGMPPE